MGSVWLDEVDQALYDLVTSNIKYNGEDKDLLVTIRNPQGEYVVEQFPCITISNIGERFAHERYYETGVVLRRDIDRARAVVQKSALPYNLSYRIEIWTDFQQDMNDLTRQWNSKIDPHFPLEVKDSSGTTRYSTVDLVNTVVLSEDVSEGAGRKHFETATILRRIYEYEIWVELDEALEVEKPIVIEREVQANRLINKEEDK